MFELLKQHGNDSEIKNLNFFWLGFVLYYVPKIYFHLAGDISFLIPAAIQSIGLILIFLTSFNLIKWRIENNYLKAVFTIYFIWLALIVLRGLPTDFQEIVELLFNERYGAMPYLVPLLIFFPQKFLFYKQLFRVILLLGLIYLAFNIKFKGFLFGSNLNSRDVRGFIEHSSMLCVPTGFILLTYKYHKLNVKIFSTIVFFIGLIIVTYGARRNLIFIFSTQILFSALLYLSMSNKKIILIPYSIFLSFFLIYYAIDTFYKKDNRLFSLLKERGMEDTRTGVELAFYADFDEIDWVIGRGYSGTYFCPGIEENKVYRDVIETGYLQMILRGGLISLILILLIAVPAFFFGVLYSKNTLSKAAGIWIFLWILYLYPTTMEAFSLYYLIFWISIGICYSKDIRNMSDEDILKKLHLKKKLDNRVIFNYHY